jgi:hypothetical protein
MILRVIYAAGLGATAPAGTGSPTISSQERFKSIHDLPGIALIFCQFQHFDAEPELLSQYGFEVVRHRVYHHEGRKGTFEHQSVRVGDRRS